MNDKKMRKKIPKFRSKKGMSLVELIVGVAIMAMAISSAAGAIVTGYKTTIDNAVRNEAAAKCASLNEVIMKGIKNCEFEDKDAADSYFFKKPVYDASGNLVRNDNTTPNDNDNDSIMKVGKELFSDLYYCTSADFPVDEYDIQYQLDINAVEDLNAQGEAAPIHQMKGIKIRTAVNVPDGYVEITSFVPYVNQD